MWAHRNDLRFCNRSTLKKCENQQGKKRNLPKKSEKLAIVFEYVSCADHFHVMRKTQKGDQQNTNTNEPATKRRARRRRDRNVEVCGNGSSDGAAFFVLCA